MLQMPSFLRNFVLAVIVNSVFFVFLTGLMADWKNIFAMSRHERVGLLVVMAFITVTLVALWLSSKSSPSTDQIDQQALERFAESVDSLRESQQHSDSVAKASKKQRKHAKSTERRDSTHHKKTHKHSSPSRKSPPPQRDLKPLPQFEE